MTKQLTTMIAVLALAGSVSAQTKKAEGLTGTWNMGLQGGHVIPVALVLTQEGETLTGVVSMPTQKIGQTVDVPLKGTLARGAFSLSGTVEGAKDPTTIEITLIDKNRTHVWKPKLHEIASGSMDLSAHEVDYLAQAHWHHFRFRIGEMTALTPG